MANLTGIFTADLHGEESHYECLYQELKRIHPQGLFLGGDLFPKKGGLWKPSNTFRTPQMQAEFIQSYFLPFLRKVSKICSVYFIFGNDDFACNERLFSELPKNVSMLNGEKTESWEEYTVAGYPYVSLTPFLLKDWEKWDVREDPAERKIFMTDGFVIPSVKEGSIPVSFVQGFRRGETIKQDLLNQSKSYNPARTVCLIHEPPIQTVLDLASTENPFLFEEERHVGSLGVRQFIEDKQPLLTLHGHIHETVRESGSFFEIIGESFCVSSGEEYNTETLSYVFFAMGMLNTMQRKTVRCTKYG